MHYRSSIVSLSTFSSPPGNTSLKTPSRKTSGFKSTLQGGCSKPRATSLFRTLIHLSLARTPLSVCPQCLVPLRLGPLLSIFQSFNLFLSRCVAQMTADRSAKIMNTALGVTCRVNPARSRLCPNGNLSPPYYTHSVDGVHPSGMRYAHMCLGATGPFLPL